MPEGQVRRQQGATDRKAGALCDRRCHFEADPSRCRRIQCAPEHGVDIGRVVHGRQDGAGGRLRDVKAPLCHQTVLDQQFCQSGELAHWKAVILGHPAGGVARVVDHRQGQGACLPAADPTAWERVAKPSASIRAASPALMRVTRSGPS